MHFRHYLPVGALIAAFLSVLTQYNSSYYSQLLPFVEGEFKPEFINVALALKKNMESGLEQGSAFVVYYDGEPVLDMWAGYADIQSLRRWRNDTTTMLFGAGQAITAFLVALMVDRGLLNYSAPLRFYWSGCQSEESSSVTLEHLLSHQISMPYLKNPVSLRDLQSNMHEIEKDLCKMISLKVNASQPVSYDIWSALILDRLLEQVDPKHRSIEQLVQEEISDPFGIEINMALARENYHKTARLYPPTMLQTLYQILTSPRYMKTLISRWVDSQSVVYRSFQSLKELTMSYNVFNDPEIREVPLSSLTATATARDLARLYSILSVGGNHHGNQVLKQETIHKLEVPVVEQTCSLNGLQVKYGQGVQIYQNPWGQSVLGHSGYGGQIVLADRTNRLAMAYVTSYLSTHECGDDQRFLELQRGVYESLQKYIDHKH
ncbi:beta-lactamase domain-containing protein 2-like [Dreissena polymorpha]|nr:beta-lactamase domain-containing protein 2-like [Dreissena polymorpha]